MNKSRFERAAAARAVTLWAMRTTALINGLPANHYVKDKS